MMPDYIFHKLINTELLARYYSVPTRSYHNVFHALDVYNSVMDIAPDASKELQLAALWHDVVYIPGSSYNEIQSGELLVHEAKMRGYSGTGINKAAELITNTTKIWHFHLSNIVGDLAILLDADLSQLACDYDSFYQNQENICAEHFRGINFAHIMSLQADFLYKLLHIRPNIFHTVYGRTHYEAKAIENITRFKLENG